MITVLWLIAAASIVALTGTLAGRTTVSAARNRVQAERAFWAGVGCARRTQAEIDSLLGAAATLDEDASIWRMLDRRIVPHAKSSSWPCEVWLEAAGARMDVNAATPEMIGSVLRTLGESDGQAAAMADALMDWRDTDQVASPLGAERPWYEREIRALPRNAPLEDIRALALVRGFENISLFASVFTTEPGRISLAHASAEVLSAVPGITRETADLIASLSEMGTPVIDVSTLAGRVSAQSATELMSRYADIVRFTTSDPDAWLLDVRATNGDPKTTVTIHWRLIRTGRRCSVVRSRTAL
jgi:general secretion pathway protein K